MEAKLQQRIDYFQSSLAKVPLAYNEEIIQNEFRKQEILREEMQSFLSASPQSSSIQNMCAEAEEKILENEKMLSHFGSISPLGNSHSSIVEATLAKVIELNADPLQNLRSSRDDVSNRLDSVWSWVERLSRCSQLHLQNAGEYHRFFQESASLREAANTFLQITRDEVTPEKIRRRQNANDRVNFDANFITEALTTLKGALQSFKDLEKRSEGIVPIQERVGLSRSPKFGCMLADYQSVRGSFTFEEEVEILDSSLAEMWQIRSRSRDLQASVPSLVVWIPPINPEALDQIVLIRSTLWDIWSQIIDILRSEVVNCLKETLEQIVENYETVEVCSLQKLKKFVKLVENGLLQDTKDHNALQLRVVIQKLCHATTVGAEKIHQTHSLDRHTYFLSSLKLIHMDRLASGIAELIDCRRDLEFVVRPESFESWSGQEKTSAGKKYSAKDALVAQHETLNSNLSLGRLNARRDQNGRFSPVELRLTSCAKVTTKEEEDEVLPEDVLSPILRAKEVSDLYDSLQSPDSSSESNDSESLVGVIEDATVEESHQACQTESLDIYIDNIIYEREMLRQMIGQDHPVQFFEKECQTKQLDFDVFGTQTSELPEIECVQEEEVQLCAVPQKYKEDEDESDEEYKKGMTHKSTSCEPVFEPELELERLIETLLEDRNESDIRSLFNSYLPPEENADDIGSEVSFKLDCISQTSTSNFWESTSQTKEADLVERGSQIFPAMVALIHSDTQTLLGSSIDLERNAKKLTTTDYSSQTVKCAWDFSGQTFEMDTWDSGEQTVVDASDYPSQTEEIYRADFGGQTFKNMSDFLGQTVTVKVCDVAGQTLKKVADFCGQSSKNTGEFSSQTLSLHKDISIESSVKSKDSIGQTVHVEMCDFTGQTLKSNCDFSLQMSTEGKDSASQEGFGIFDTTSVLIQTSIEVNDKQLGSEMVEEDASQQTDTDLLFNWMSHDGGFWNLWNANKSQGDKIPEHMKLFEKFRKNLFHEASGLDIGCQNTIASRDFAVEMEPSGSDYDTQTEKELVLDWIRPDGGFWSNWGDEEACIVPENFKVLEKIRKNIHCESSGLDIAVQTAKASVEVSTEIGISEKNTVIQTDKDLVLQWIEPDGGFWKDWASGNTGGEVSDHFKMLESFRQKLFHEKSGPDVAMQTEKFWTDTSTTMHKVELNLNTQTEDDLIVKWISPDGGFWTRWNTRETGDAISEDEKNLESFRKKIFKEKVGPEIALQTDFPKADFGATVKIPGLSEFVETDKDLVFEWIGPKGSFWSDWSAGMDGDQLPEHLKTLESFRKKVFHEKVGPEVALQTDSDLLVQWMSPDGGFWKTWQAGNPGDEIPEHLKLLERFRQNLFHEKAGPDIGVQTVKSTTDFGTTMNLVERDLIVQTDSDLVLNWIGPQGGFWDTVNLQAEGKELPEHLKHLEHFRQKLFNEKTGPEISLQTGMDLIIDWMTPEGGFWSALDTAQTGDDIPEHLKLFEGFRKKVFNETAGPEMNLQTDMDLLTNWMSADGGFWDNWNTSKEDNLPEHMKMMEQFRQRLFHEQGGTQVSSQTDTRQLSEGVNCSRDIHEKGWQFSEGVSLQTDKNLILQWMTPEGGFWNYLQDDNMDDSSPEHLQMLQGFKKKVFNETSGPAFGMQTESRQFSDGISSSRDMLKAGTNFNSEVSLTTDVDLILTWMNAEGGFWEYLEKGMSGADKGSNHLKMLEGFKKKMFNESNGPEFGGQTDSRLFSEGISSSKDVDQKGFNCNPDKCLTTELDLVLAWLSPDGGFWQLVEEASSKINTSEQWNLLKSFKSKMLTDQTASPVGIQTDIREFSEAIHSYDSSEVSFTGSSKVLDDFSKYSTEEYSQGTQTVRFRVVEEALNSSSDVVHVDGDMKMTFSKD